MLKNNRGLTLIEVLVTVVIMILLMGALFSFSQALQSGMVDTRKTAYSGHSVENALTMLRQELAGATELLAFGNRLYYNRVRDGESWMLELDGTTLQRRRNEDVVRLATNIDQFSFELPSAGDRIINVSVLSGNFELDDEIFLRNPQEFDSADASDGETWTLGPYQTDSVSSDTVNFEESFSVTPSEHTHVLLLSLHFFMEVYNQTPNCEPSAVWQVDLQYMKDYELVEINLIPAQQITKSTGALDISSSVLELPETIPSGQPFSIVIHGSYGISFHDFSSVSLHFDNISLFGY